MTEEEKMVFWGDLVEPMTALVGGLAVRGEYKLADVVRAIVDKAENAALEEREACAKVCDGSANEAPNSWQFRMGANHCAEAIRARGQG
jgi:hypothetical protein